MSNEAEIVDLYFVEGLEVFTVPMEHRGEWYHLPSNYRGKYTHSMVHSSHASLTRYAALESARYAAIEKADDFERDAQRSMERAEMLARLRDKAEPPTGDHQ